MFLCGFSVPVQEPWCGARVKGVKVQEAGCGEQGRGWRVLSVTEARVVIEEWRSFYNRVHPHSRLGFQSPDGFARIMAQLEPVPGT